MSHSDTILVNADRAEEQRKINRRKPPLIRVWDGNWGFIGTVADAIEGSFQWKLNDTGTGTLVLRGSDPVGIEVMNVWDRTSAKNIHVTVDKDGARWSGRLKEATLEKTNSGETKITLIFLHDFEELKHVLCWPNPFLPALIQFPRTHVLMGPTAWVLKQFLALNLARIAGVNWLTGDDPLHETKDRAKNARQHIRDNAPFIVAPHNLGVDKSPWTICGSRMKYWHDIAAPKLIDSQLVVTTRRWLQGDSLPWENLPAGTPETTKTPWFNDRTMRHGTLIVDIVDKGTLFTGGGVSLWDTGKGILSAGRALLGDASNWVENTQPATTNINNAPYVLYREGRLTGIESSGFVYQPATTTRTVVGGHSPYGVNELISSALILMGNYIGLLLACPSLGAIADTLLKPLFTDTLAAWMQAIEKERQKQLGWSHYLERFQDGADKAYTLSAMAALRQGFVESREIISCSLNIRDGAPWYVGDNGEGDFFLGDIIAAQIIGLPANRVLVQAVTELTYKFSRDNVGWNITVGDRTVHETALERVTNKVKNVASLAHDLGVM